MRREITKIGLAVVENGSLLLVRKRGSTCYILPGGKPHPGEDELTALWREIHEELGCTLDPGTVVYVGSFRDRAAGMQDTDVVVKLYVGKLVGHPTPQAEIDNIVWFDPRSGRATELAPSLTNAIVPHLFDVSSPRFEARS